MRFCPFCSAENADELAACAACGRRLPPLPPRRARNAPPTGVQLPPRAHPATVPPAMPRTQTGPTPAPVIPVSAPPMPRTRTAPFPPPAAPTPAQVGPDYDPTQQSLLAAISPGPAAQRAVAPVDVPELHIPSRRQHDRAEVRAGLPPPGPHAPPAPITPPPPAAVEAPTYPTYSRASFEANVATAAVADDRQPRAPVVPTRSSSSSLPTPSGEPPPTRIQRPEAHVDRPFTPPAVNPIPEIPEPSLFGAARYAVRFGRARWQRRGAIKTLGSEIKQDTEALDQVLGALGRVARSAKVEGRVFSAENAAINAADERASSLGREHSDVDTRKLDENARFIDVEVERNTKLGEAERLVDEAQKELSNLEAQRRGLRDRRRDLERRQKAYLKNAEDDDRQSTSSQMGDARQELRRSAEEHRRNAAAIEPERQAADRQITALERPINEATARLDAAKAELDAAKRSLADAREGHTHRLAELDAEQKRKSREIAQAEAEITRRLVTLGTLVNLNRIEDPAFEELYLRIDRLRGAITARTTEIEKLNAEREAYDRGTLVRGIATIGGAIVAFIALIVILRAIV